MDSRRKDLEMKAKLTTRTIQSLLPTERRYEVRDSELPGFLLRVGSTGSMVYSCDVYRPDGRRTRITIGDAKILTPAQARDEALKILGDCARGIDPAKERKTARHETLEGFIAKHYQPWVEAHRKTGARTVQSALARFSDFKADRLSDITPWKIEKWRSARLKLNKAATVNRNVTMLKAILEKAVEWELIDTNPLARVKPLKTDQAAKIRFLDQNEESALRQQLDDREARIRVERQSHNSWLTQRHRPTLQNLDQCAYADYLKPMVLLSINTGLRRGEVFSLKWADVDLQRKILTVEGSNAKSGKTRHIPLNNEALAVLQGWKAQASVETGLVFIGRGGRRFDNVQTSWEAVLEDAGIKTFRWHDLRHHFASMLVMNGVDLNTVRELLGHGDIKMTLRYAHLAPQVKAEAVAKLNRAQTFSSTVIKFSTLGL